MPKRDLSASETKFRRRKMIEKKKAEKSKKLKVLDDNDGWEVADGE